MAPRDGITPDPWLWPGPRALVEHTDETAGLAIASALRQVGYAVAVCPGPDARDRCPLTGPDGCAAAEGADLIVSALGTELPERRSVLHALRTRCPSARLVVVDPSAKSLQVAGALADARPRGH